MLHKRCELELQQKQDYLQDEEEQLQQQKKEVVNLYTCQTNFK
ncbi:unnamed protein product [Paramecium pentaurelia]|uniref:Uncharacterized protein n=1 Tax=Paramecium pentaurelia TaxID=43138 RepID=A0A8S1W9E3_9CILI|nr:unnamed protein product [Paramecium pentaurelia]